MNESPLPAYHYPRGALLTRSGDESRLLHVLCALAGSDGIVRIAPSMAEWLAAADLGRIADRRPRRFDAVRLAAGLEAIGVLPVGRGEPARAGSQDSLLIVNLRPAMESGTLFVPQTLVEHGWLRRLSTHGLWLLNALFEGIPWGGPCDNLAARHARALAEQGRRNAPASVARALAELISAGLIEVRAGMGDVFVPEALGRAEPLARIAAVPKLLTWQQGREPRATARAAALAALACSTDAADTLDVADHACRRMASLSPADRCRMIRRIRPGIRDQWLRLRRAQPPRISRHRVRSRSTRWRLDLPAPLLADVIFPEAASHCKVAQANLVVYLDDAPAVGRDSWPVVLHLALEVRETGHPVWAAQISLNNLVDKPRLVALHHFVPHSTWGEALQLRCIPQGEPCGARVRIFLDLFPSS
jgi:hypothetical protein